MPDERFGPHPSRRYDARFRGGGPGSGPFRPPVEAGWMYQPAFWGWSPMGWAGWGPGMEYMPAVPWEGLREAPRPRRRPEESATYGRGGDQAVRRWGRRYGYDFEYTLRPRGPYNR